MSAGIGYQIEDISRYIDCLREQKNASVDAIIHLKKERDMIARQIEDLQVKLNNLDSRISKEQEICSRLEATIEHANETYEKVKLL
ncbi:unnamed protein product [Thelazia callipaeda]|uniref:IF rod domain-containing protein n=1 Tax=Thelazia callipaeda TaxID=103827 RepID=A0A0N5CJP0_THECL|nr:unnamed protein product [Thelazia callipaeda]